MRSFSTFTVVLLCVAASVCAEEAQPLLKSRDPFGAKRYKALRIPLSDATLERTAREHPMLPALRYAYEKYQGMQQSVQDYQGRLVMRERIQGRLKPREYMHVKVRHARVDRENQVVPFAVYLNYLAPKATKGREVLYVEGKNDGRMVATRGGGRALNDITLWLQPDSERAMKGKHYPVSDIGIMKLASRLIEYGTGEMLNEASQHAKVRFVEGAKINKRSCTMIEVTHPTRTDGLLYHVAQIFVDDEFQVPVRFAAYSWPREEGGAPLLMEEYTYVDLKLNVGFSDLEFEPTNPDYNFREAREETPVDQSVVSAEAQAEGDE